MDFRRAVDGPNTSRHWLLHLDFSNLDESTCRLVFHDSDRAFAVSVDDALRFGFRKWPGSFLCDRSLVANPLAGEVVAIYARLLRSSAGVVESVAQANSYKTLHGMTSLVAVARGQA